MAKVEVRNPISDVVMSQMKLDRNADTMMKKLTSSFLSSEITVMDYDLRQTSDMQGGILINLCFMWFLHFKMEKMQPLLIQITTGMLQLIYSPLFQVYVCPYWWFDAASKPTLTHCCSN